MVTMAQICNLLHGLKPQLLMMVVQVALAGVNVFYKLATNQGMSLRVIVAYRFVFATCFMVPLALIFERNCRPRFTWTVLMQAFLCGLFGGSLGQNLYAESFALTSATFASAMANLIPAVTFILAISIRLERLGLGTVAGKAKVLGTLIGIGGAMLLTFYKGIRLDFLSTKVDLLSRGRHVEPLHAFSGGGGSHVLGALLALASCFSCALWLIIQAKMSEKYSCHYTSTALMCFMGSLQAVVFALYMERDWSQWKLGWNLRLWTVAYSGIVASGLIMTLISWCIRIRGPLFVTVFSPLMLVLVALAGALFLDEKLYLGSVLGAILIVCGLYVVLWGKGKEMKKMTQLVPSRSVQHQEIEIIVNSPAESEITEKDTVPRYFDVKEQK